MRSKKISPTTSTIPQASSELHQYFEQGQGGKQQPPAPQSSAANQPADIAAARLAELERQDREKSQQEIKRLTQFLQQVAAEERKRRQEMRQRVEQSLEEKLGKGEEVASSDSTQLPPLSEPATKPKRGTFLLGLRKKGKGAMLEAKGTVAKGGG